MSTAYRNLTERFVKADLKLWFNARTLDHSKEVVKNVTQLSVSPDRILSWVAAGGTTTYRVRIDFIEGRRGHYNIRPSCTCPTGYHCIHCAATLQAALDKRTDPEEQTDNVRPGVFEWVEQLKAIAAASKTPEKKPAKRTHAIFYFIERNDTHRHWQLRLSKGPLTHDGRPGHNTESWNNIEGALNKPPSFVDDEDIAIFRLILAQQATATRSVHLDAYPLIGTRTDELLRHTVNSGRLYLTNDGRRISTTRLTEGKPRPGHFVWKDTELGTEASFRGEPPIDAAIPCQPPWYIDYTRHEIGSLALDLPPALIPHLASIPPLNKEEATIVAGVLQRVAPSIPLPPLTFPPIKEIKAPLRAVFKIIQTPPPVDGFLESKSPNKESINVGVAQFHYGDVLIRPTDGGNLIHLPNDDRVRIERDIDREDELIDGLFDAGFDGMPREFFDNSLNTSVAEIFLPGDNDLWFDFVERIQPALIADGWIVEIPDNFRYRVHSPDEWFADLEESGNQWFSLALGVVIEDKKYPLAPLIHSLLKHYPEWNDKHELAAIPDNKTMRFTLEDGTRLNLQAGRLKPLVATLIDLLDAPSHEPLKISRFDLPRVFEATKGPNWLRTGETQARQIANQLKGSEGVTPVEPPEGFQTTLRPYQKEGLAWLQYLRAHDLAGILADDMGLGKTAQALAHLLVEKQAGRLGKHHAGGNGPALIILPTSLIFNWKREAERFAPDLKVLSLHGADRKERFQQIPEHDIVLTTYPLLWRDASLLKKHTYHTLILDEAQTVKNAASKAAETVRTLTAKHRFCLTGTPLENHLGELWAQFDFLMPGLMGDAKNFKKIWQIPIEKRGDTVRRDILARRVKPFILRRKKEEVATELPPKTIILRNVELDGMQRDLYEMVRVTMDAKVRTEIASKGFARSQIVILDALLKLRQVCCDPRLLKSDAAKKVKERAKLDLLMDMLPELVDEGRRILVFSQFAGMLDLIEPELKKAKLDFVRLSGETKNRETLINRFQNEEVPIFLISLKAGGVGLNLTAADTVIHYDPWWNPAAENQATDRAHRIGQTKQVFVYKLVVAGSIEEKILTLQEKKAALAESILSDDAAALGKFSESDIAALLAPLPR